MLLDAIEESFSIRPSQLFNLATTHRNRSNQFAGWGCLEGKALSYEEMPPRGKGNVVNENKQRTKTLRGYASLIFEAGTCKNAARLNVYIRNWNNVTC